LLNVKLFAETTITGTSENFLIFLINSSPLIKGRRLPN
jgi:hypothetical protein